MSVVAARVYDNRIVIAADSITIRNWGGSQDTKYSKLVKVNEMVIGGVGLAEDNSLLFLFANTHKPSGTTEKDILEFMVEFSKWKKDFGSGDINNSYFIAFEGHLFHIAHLLVREITDYDAIGAGEDYANAALYLGHSPKEAVKTACDLCCYVAEPITQFVMVRRKEEK